jgi:hypothetical protein
MVCDGCLQPVFLLGLGCSGQASVELCMVRSVLCIMNGLVQDMCLIVRSM